MFACSFMERIRILIVVVCSFTLKLFLESLPVLIRKKNCILQNKCSLFSQLLRSNYQIKFISHKISKIKIKERKHPQTFWPLKSSYTNSCQNLLQMDSNRIEWKKKVKIFKKPNKNKEKLFFCFIYHTDWLPSINITYEEVKLFVKKEN